MKVRLLLTLAGLISLAVPASIAQDAMKVVMADELVWKQDSRFKDAQIVNLLGDPTKAETIVLRVKFPPNFQIPPHTHPFSEVVTVLSGTFWHATGDDLEKGVMLKPGSLVVLPANHIHRVWTTDEGGCHSA
jgi:quercetin dioxygenase-like cupin family protein